MQTVFKSASEWLRYEGKRRARPAGLVAYSLFIAVFILGFLVGSGSARWFQSIAFPITEAFVGAYLVFALVALRSLRVYGKFRRLVQSVADRNLREEREALGDEAWRRSAELSCRIVQEEVERLRYPVRPEFDLTEVGETSTPAGATP